MLGRYSLCLRPSPENDMSKSTATYWNVLSPDHRDRWQAIRGMEGMAEELTLSIDEATGEYTRLTRFFPGADTAAFGGKTHPLPGRSVRRQWSPLRPGIRCLAGLRTLRESPSRRTARPVQDRRWLRCIGSIFSQSNRVKVMPINFGEILCPMPCPMPCPLQSTCEC